MDSIVTTITGAFTSWISGLSAGIVSAFNGLFLTGEGASQTISNFGTFCLIMFGIGVASGLVYLVIRLIRR